MKYEITLNNITYKVGDRIKLISMVQDPHPIAPESTGVIDLIDDLNQIHVKWDCGRYLAIIPDIDSFELIR